jgi:hypothetical protein
MCAYVCSEDVVKEGRIFVAVAEGISNPELYFSCVYSSVSAWSCVCMCLGETKFNRACARHYVLQFCREEGVCRERKPKVKSKIRFLLLGCFPFSSLLLFSPSLFLSMTGGAHQEALI